MPETTNPQPTGDEADVDTVANRAAQVITSMGADIRALTSQRDRYRSAWCSARERAQAYGEGILRVVKDREQYQEWLRQAEERAAAPASPSAPAGRAALRDRIAEALLDHLSRTADIRRDEDGVLAFMPEVTDPERMRIADAVLAVLPEPAPAPSRVADEAPQPETQAEAHPAEHTWAAELHDPLADEWVPGTRYLARDRAVNALTHARRIGPTWKDGTPTQRRLVRATTTYTVEAEQPAVVSQPGKEG